MKLYSALAYLLLLLSLSLLVHSCAKDKLTTGIEIEGTPLSPENPIGVDTSTGNPFICEAWQLFYREENAYGYRMSCAPYFGYDRVIAKAPIQLHSEKMQPGVFAGKFYALQVQRPVLLSYSEAEAQQSLIAQALLTNFRAEQRGGIWYCTLDNFAGKTELPAVEFRISNRNGDTHVYRAMVVWSDADFLYEAVVFWAVPA